MNTVDNFLQVPSILIYVVFALFLLLGIIVLIIRLSASKRSPLRGMWGLGMWGGNNIMARLLFTLGGKAIETPYLLQTTLRTTLGVRLGVVLIVAIMAWFIFGGPLPEYYSRVERHNDPLGWAILGISTYYMLWVFRFYVTYDESTLETIDWMHRKKRFDQKKLISVYAQQQSQTYRLQYDRGHVDVLMYVQNRKAFLRDMDAKIAEYNARLL